MNKLLRLPKLDATTTTVRNEGAPSNPPPQGSCWSHNGETVMIVTYSRLPNETYSDGIEPVQLLRAVDGVAKAHEATYWKSVEVYEP